MRRRMGRRTVTMQRRMSRRRRMRRRRRRRRRRMILVGGMVALGTAAVYKFSKKDVERIEEKTGKSAEDLSDEELQQAVADLQIQVDELSDAEYDQVEKFDEAEDAIADKEAAASGKKVAAGGGSDDYIEQLTRLGELNKAGIITDEEFEAKKKQLLGL